MTKTAAQKAAETPQSSQVLGLLLPPPPLLLPPPPPPLLLLLRQKVLRDAGMAAARTRGAPLLGRARCEAVATRPAHRATCCALCRNIYLWPKVLF
jgi:hypothetical protein